jgi:hypothetical protein
VQQAGRAAVNAPAATAEDASLSTSRWCQSRDCRRRDTPGCPCYCCRFCCQSHRSRCSYLYPSSCPYHRLSRRCWKQEGEGPPEDTTVHATVGAEAAATMKGALLLRARRPVPELPSGPAQSPRVRGHYERCGRRGRLRPLDENLYVIEPLVQAL